MCNCNQAFSQLSFTGAQGVSITNVTSVLNGANTDLTFVLSNGGSIGPISVPNGTNGANGTDATGIAGGFSSVWNFDAASLLANPASSYVRFDSATYASVTTIYIHDTNDLAVNMDTFLDYFDNSGDFGIISVVRQDDPSEFWIGKITAVVDSGTYHTLTVTYITSNGAFSTDNNVVVSFIPAAAAVTVTNTNIGTGVDVYKDGTSYDFRTLLSSDSSITITQNTNDLDFSVNYNDWVECQATGSGSTTEPVFQNPGGGFSDTSNQAGYETVACKIDASTGKVVMKGACKLTGAGSYGFAPTGAANVVGLAIMSLPVALSPGVGTQGLTKAILYDAVNAHTSTVTVNVTAGGLALLVDKRLNFLEDSTIICFDGTSYSL